MRAYRLATSEALRWQKRRARAKHATLPAGTPGLDEVFLASATPSDASPGLLKRGARNAENARLLAAAPDTVQGLATALIGKRVRVDKLAGLPISRPMATTRYSNRCFGTMLLPEEVEQQWRALREELLVDDSAPPLTLEAAVALERAKRGDFLAAECEIVHVALEPLTYRFVTLKSATQRIVTLETIPVEDFDNWALEQVLVRCELRPLWLWHENYLWTAAEMPTENPSP